MGRNKPSTRRCAGCRETRPKGELLRVARADGVIEVDRSGKAPGRGAYLCPSRGCFEKAYKRKGLERSFGLPVPQAVYERLSEYVSSREAL
jgi:predicted RNA-binding protein YlxR (DUF448 family)